MWPDSQSCRLARDTSCELLVPLCIIILHFFLGHLKGISPFNQLPKVEEIIGVSDFSGLNYFNIFKNKYKYKIFELPPKCEIYKCQHQETHQIQNSQGICQSEIQLFIPNRIQTAIDDLGLCRLVQYNESFQHFVVKNMLRKCWCQEKQATKWNQDINSSYLIP